jgi:hypothetical protein
MLGLGNSLSTSQYMPFSSTKSVDFDGSDDRMNTGAHFSAVFDGSFTLSAWVKPDDGRPDSANEMIMGVKDNTGNCRISFLLKTNGNIIFTYDSNDADALTDCESSAVWSDGESTWKHLVLTMNATNGAMVIYANAVSVGTETEDEYDDISSFSASQSLYIGSRNNAGSQDLGWAGLIDEVGIWNVALSAGQVSDIYNGGKPHDLTTPLGEGLSDYSTTNARTNLQAYYRMGDGTENGSGTTVYDMSANSNNGTLVGGPAYSLEGALVV